MQPAFREERGSLEFNAKAVFLNGPVETREVHQHTNRGLVDLATAVEVRVVLHPVHLTRAQLAKLRSALPPPAVTQIVRQRTEPLGRDAFNGWMDWDDHRAELLGWFASMM